MYQSDIKGIIIFQFSFKKKFFKTNLKKYQLTNMLKYILIAISIVSVCSANSRGLGGGQIVNGTLTTEVSNMADWTLSQIATYTGISGVYSINNISNIQIQIVRGVKYFLKIR